MNQQEYDELHGYSREDPNNWVMRKAKNCALVVTKDGFKKALKRRLPILNWLSRYPAKQLSPDFFAGVTTGIYNVPQAMSYSTLAGLPPAHGLYASFFSPLFYSIFGSSPTSSIGVFSITCLLVNTCIEKMQHGDNAIRFPGLTSIEIITSLCLLTGIFQAIMSVLRFDKAMLLLPESAVSAITFSACFFGIVNQIPKIFGFSVPHRNEFMFSLFHSMYDIAVHITKLNEMTTFVSAGSLLFLILAQMFFEPQFKKICKKFPFPRDLILMTLAINVSYFMNLDAEYGVQTLRTVPRGFPHFGIPRVDLELLIEIAPNAASIAIVAYSVTIAMGRMFASELKYRLDNNQELLALGITNIGSSFFPVFPTSCSLSRTVVNKDSGARSQLSGIVSALIILGVIMFFGVFLEPLPKCVLATIVVFVVRSLLKNCLELPYFWRCSKNDFWIWIVTAIATLCTDIAPGVAVGIAFALLTLAIPFLQPTTKRLGQIGDHDFRAKAHYPTAKETPFPIIRFDAPLIFCNAEKFTDMVNEEIAGRREKGENGSLEAWTAIILDCHTWTYTDSMGMDVVKEANDCLHRFNVILLFANLKSSVRRQYRAAGLIEEHPINEEDLEREGKRIEQEESRIQEEKKTLSSVRMKMDGNKIKCVEAKMESGGHDDEEVSHIEIKISQDQKQLAEDEKKLVHDKKILVQIRNELKMKQKKLEEFNNLSPEDQEKKRNEEVKKISYNQIYPSIQDALLAAPELITKQQELFDIKKCE